MGGLGEMIDYLFVQFYNQGIGKHVDYDSLFLAEPFLGSITDMIQQGIDSRKLILGKPLRTMDSSNGYVPLKTLNKFICRWNNENPKSNIGGAFFWMWRHGQAAGDIEREGGKINDCNAA